MTIDELIERLEEYRDNLGGDAEVRLMTQKHWPFENAVDGLVSNEDIRDAEYDGEDDEPVEGEDPVVYLCEGAQLGYGSKKAWEHAY